MITTPKPLTAREKEVLCHVRDGRKNKQIARDLGIRPQTIHNHLKMIYAKLGVKSRTMAVLIAIQDGQIELEDTKGGESERNPGVPVSVDDGCHNPCAFGGPA